MNTFSPHLERGQAQQPAALYSTISTRVPTGERKQSHGSSSCIALPKFSFNEINMEDVTHAKVILIYVVTGSGHRQRNHTNQTSAYTYTAEQVTAFCPAVLPAHPASAYKALLLCTDSLIFRKYLCLETMDPATAQGSWEESWSEGG